MDKEGIQLRRRVGALRVELAAQHKSCIWDLKYFDIVIKKYIRGEVYDGTNLLELMWYLIHDRNYQFGLEKYTYQKEGKIYLKSTYFECIKLMVQLEEERFRKGY